MKSSFRAPLTAFAASIFAIAAAGALAQSDQPPGPPAPPAMHIPPGPPPPWMQHWAQDHEALLNAKLGGLRAGLGLNPDQEKLWGPFESAVRAAAQMRMEHMENMMEHRGQMRHMGEMGMQQGEGMQEGMGMEEGEGMSPIDRLDRLASRLTQAGAALQKVADAAKPLYASLDDTQKRMFGFLAHEMMAMGHGPGGMGPWGHHHPRFEDEGEPDDE
jgi:LTXXQ motif family protein